MEHLPENVYLLIKSCTATIVNRKMKHNGALADTDFRQNNVDG